MLPSYYKLFTRCLIRVIQVFIFSFGPGLLVHAFRLCLVIKEVCSTGKHSHHSTRELGSISRRISPHVKPSLCEDQNHVKTCECACMSPLSKDTDKTLLTPLSSTFLLSLPLFFQSLSSNRLMCVISLSLLFTTSTGHGTLLEKYAI